MTSLNKFEKKTAKNACLTQPFGTKHGLCIPFDRSVTIDRGRSTLDALIIIFLFFNNSQISIH